MDLLEPLREGMRRKLNDGREGGSRGSPGRNSPPSALPSCSSCVSLWLLLLMALVLLLLLVLPTAPLSNFLPLSCIPYTGIYAQQHVFHPFSRTQILYLNN